MMTRWWEQRILDLEQALARERERAAALQRRCDLLEAARGITARLLASGSRPAIAEERRGPAKVKAHPWREHSACPRSVKSGDRSQKVESGDHFQDHQGGQER
jgi:hypothetical protein